MSVSSPRSRNLVQKVTLLASACMAVNIVGCIVIALVVVSHICFLTNLHANVIEDFEISVENKSESFQLLPSQDSLRESQATCVTDASRNESHPEDPPPLDPVVQLKMMTDDQLLHPGGSAETLNAYEVLSYSTPEPQTDPADSATHAKQLQAEDHHILQNTRKKSPAVADVSPTYQSPEGHGNTRKHLRTADSTAPAAPFTKPPLQPSRNPTEHRKMRNHRRSKPFTYKVPRRRQDLQVRSRP